MGAPQGTECAITGSGPHPVSRTALDLRPSSGHLAARARYKGSFARPGHQGRREPEG